MQNPIAASPSEIGDKTIPVMLYTHNAMILGEVSVVSQIRVNTWLKTNSAPDIVQVSNAKVIFTSGAAPSRPQLFPETHIPISEILAMHILPPTSEPLDYDPSEPNRHMLPVSILFNAFKAEGFIWISTKVDLKKFIELNRESYTSIYDVQITSPLFPTLPTIKVPMMICRQPRTIFSRRDVSTATSE
jgi:hypothetical protein